MAAEVVDVVVVRVMAVAKGQPFYVDRAMAVVSRKVPGLAFVFIAAHVLQDAFASLVNIDVVN